MHTSLTEQFANLTFGVEIETTRRNRRRVAYAIRSVVGGCVDHVGGVYDAWEVRAADGRVWRCVRDSSVTGGGWNGGAMAEVVSPVLRYDDMATLQKVVRAIRRCGAKVDSTCGMHIHIGADAFTTKALVNLMKIVYRQEDLIYAALRIENRQHWAAKIGTRNPAGLMNKINGGTIRTLDDLRAAWYEHSNPHPSHYDGTRYHGVNLHNVFFRGTVEFRWFAATLHAGKVKAYIQFVLALAAKAIRARGAAGRVKRAVDNSTLRYDWRAWLVHMGLNGDEFKTARLHLMALLPEGDSSYKHGRPTEAEQAAAEAAVQHHMAHNG